MLKGFISSKTTIFASLLLFALSLGSYSASAAIPSSVNGQPVPSLAPIIEKTAPAVVNISVSGTRTTSHVQNPFGFLFGPGVDPRQGTNKRPFQGLGSGVIIDADEGLVITNNHVIDQADEIKVALNDGREFTAKLLGKDKYSDVALLQIEADELFEVKLADSDQLKVGDFAIAIGNPFGLGQTVTSGIVSALARSGLNMEAVENFIQTDAAINQGNSGGALLNLKGELIGMNTAIIAPGGGNIGIGFAIPANMILNITQQLQEYGEVRRAMLGIMGQELTPDLAKTFASSANKGAFVSQVLPNSAADKAGIRAGDVIVAMEAKAVNSFAELRAKVATAGVGTKIKLTISRDGKKKDVYVTLGESSLKSMAAKSLHPVLEGAELSSEEEGVTVSKLEKRSPAARAGLMEGDVIIGVNRQRVKDLSQLESVIKASKSKTLALNIKRGSASLYLVVN